MSNATRPRGKITLDLDALVDSGQITVSEADRLADLALPGSMVARLIQVLYIFGALAIAGGVLALKPDASTGLVLALIALGFAVFAKQSQRDDIAMLGQAMAIAGTAGICGWLGVQFGENTPGIIINGVMTLAVLASALYFGSLFLIAFVPLGVATMIGSGTGYWHASYYLFVEEPTITILLFCAMAFGFGRFADRFSGLRAQQARIAERMSWVVANFGFWVGSLWGDWPGQHFLWFDKDNQENWAAREAWQETAFHIHELVFVAAWAAACLAVVVVFRNNRFAVNAAITFLAINFYTQFFEHFADNAFALIIGGFTLLAFAFGLFRFDRSRFGQGRVA